MKIYFILFCFTFTNLIFSQTAIKKDSVPAKLIKIFNTNYKEFKMVGNDVYAITKGDSLVRFNIQTESRVFLLPKVISIAKSITDTYVGFNKNNIVFKIEEDKVKFIDTIYFKGIEKIKNFVPYEIISYQNNYIVLTNCGIIFNKIRYKVNKRNVHNLSVSERLFDKPDLVYLDTKNRLWLCFDRGEFGESLVFFDLEKKKYFEHEYLSLKNSNYSNNSVEYALKMNKKYSNQTTLVGDKLLFKIPYNLPIFFPVKGIAQNENGKFLLTQSLMHFMLNGNLFFLNEENKYVNYTFLKKLVEYEEPFDENSHHFNSTLEYVGGCTFNNFDNFFYYYTNRGFFKIIETDKGVDRELYLKPMIKWDFGLPNSLGYQMNVTKFEFISEKELVFLTTNNGIGYYNGTEVKYFQ